MSHVTLTCDLLDQKSIKRIVYSEGGNPTFWLSERKDFYTQTDCQSVCV